MPDEPAEMSILFDLWLINHLLTGALDDVLVDASGLTGEDFGFYSLVRRFGPLTPTRVSRWTAMPATTVSATVRRLADRGHVAQNRNPADGRSRLIALTDAGVAAHAVTAATFFSQTRPLATALGSDEHQQRLSLQRLDAALRQVSGLDPRPYAVAATSGTGTAVIATAAASGATADSGPIRPTTSETRCPATDVGDGGLESAERRHPQLSYLGPTLRPDEEDAVRTYIDFVRSRRK
jgi:DNA-binding MarR family transcriptional regulator